MHPRLQIFANNSLTARSEARPDVGKKKKITDGSSTVPLHFMTSHQTTMCHGADDGVVYPRRQDNLQSCIFSSDKVEMTDTHSLDRRRTLLMT